MSKSPNTCRGAGHLPAGTNLPRAYYEIDAARAAGETFPCKVCGKEFKLTKYGYLVNHKRAS